MSTEDAFESATVHSIGVPYVTGSKCVRFIVVWRVGRLPSSSEAYLSNIISPPFNKDLKFRLEASDRTSLRKFSVILDPCVTPNINIKFSVHRFCEQKMIHPPSEWAFRYGPNGNFQRGQVEIPSPIERYRQITREEQDEDELWACCDTNINDVVFYEIELTGNVNLMPHLSVDTSVVVSQSQLVDNLRELFTTREHSDVTIDVCGQTFPAHKAILTMRSPVFSAMFKHKMSENEESRVCITDMEPEVFLQLLRFIYTGETSALNKIAHELLEAADKYDIGKLKIMCEKAVFTKVTIDNAAETLIFADNHRANGLKDDVTTFIVRNLKEVMTIQGLQSMSTSHGPLLLEILSQCATELRLIRDF